MSAAAVAPPQVPAPAPSGRSPQALPHALEHVAYIAQAAGVTAAAVGSTANINNNTSPDKAPPPPTRRLVFFLDYDGTLSPIVPDPDAALMTEETRAALARLAKHHTTAIVTGRSLDKVRKLVDLDQLIYAGSHGFDIDGPRDVVPAHTVGAEFRPHLSAAALRVRHELLPHYPGATLEDNCFALSVHYRNVDHDKCSIVDLGNAVSAIAADLGLKRTQGKMVYEIRPLLNWNKGKAVEFLLDKLHVGGPDVLPIYIGDDITDEDAFEAVSRRGGISVIVADAGVARATAADLRLSDTHEVVRFLNHFGGTDAS